MVPLTPHPVPNHQVGEHINPATCDDIRVGHRVWYFHEGQWLEVRVTALKAQIMHYPHHVRESMEVQVIRYHVRELGRDGECYYNVRRQELSMLLVPVSITRAGAQPKKRGCQWPTRAMI